MVLLITMVHGKQDTIMSKELGMLRLTVEHNYIYYYIIGVYNNYTYILYITLYYTPPPSPA